MAINKNHEFEELNGVKCAIVEKNVFTQRADFLKQLLELNKYNVIVVPSPAPKPAAPKPPATGENSPPAVAPEQAAPQPETFTVGVTDVTFNPTNAIFGRLLHTREGHVVTLSYWQQKDAVSNDEVPYFETD